MSTTRETRPILRLTAAIILGMTAHAAHAHDPGDYSTWMQFAKHNTQGFTTECWADPGDPTAPLAAVEVGKRYFVPANMTMKAPAETATFKAMVPALPWADA